MCGIAGFVGEGEESDLARMLRAQAYRGPDEEGSRVDGESRVFFGHLRLAIVDLAGGRQPMTTQDGRLWVTFGGEIYNHMALRRELEAAGHRFQTDHSDTEVLLHGYREWGEELPRRLNGMFAFAIYDRDQKRLFLARDRFGEKPLFYFVGQHLFAFASEIKALRRHRSIDTAIDGEAVRKFLAYGFMPAPYGLYKNIFKLPQGSWLSHGLGDREPRVVRYWRYRVEPDPTLARRSVDDLAAELSGLLREAVRSRLMADVPLGIFLSGGLDSTAVLALAAAARPDNAVKSFSIGFAEPSYDETSWARLASRAIGSEHSEEMLSLDAARGLIPRLLPSVNEPLGDPSILPTYLVSAFARRSVKVALSGDGGDELFAGYDPFLALAPASLYRALVPRSLHRAVRLCVERLPVATTRMSLSFRVRQTLAGLTYPPKLWNPVWLAPGDPNGLAELLAEPVDIETVYSEAIECWESASSPDPVDRSLEFYGNFYLPEAVLTKTDRASMQASLEVRAPFLENDLVDFVRRLPSRFKLRGGQRKYLFRKAIAGLVPEPILKRGKQGFGIPLVAWMRSELNEPPRPCAGALDAAVVKRIWGQHRTGKRDHARMLWALLALERATA
ncbi:MAG: asparagine synthase (glutamine-hydrolyzing) [Proteobacteria bacterium]|nr:asparagine synthase (glutamine-hydrolyzing) [Pseudomonadota bacterium]MBI3497200.1 asparagine synthase (glutamine-hydrolyzing) [Pseudomonadota bacterium]